MRAGIFGQGLLWKVEYSPSGQPRYLWHWLLSVRDATRIFET